MTDYSFLNYELPEDRIAQHPIGKGDVRSSARLLAGHFSTSGFEIADYRFATLPELLTPGDLIVLNNSQVLPCRFFVNPVGDGYGAGGDIEILFVRSCQSQDVEDCWECLARPMKRLKLGKAFALSERLSALPLGRTEDGNRLILKLSARDGYPGTSIEELLREEALMPIPPYIRGGHADVEDRETYQTIFAKNPGSIAAPTAGLHFTESLFDSLEANGIKRVYVTLHVGTASFTPIREADVEHHQMATESYEISPEAAEEIHRAKVERRRIIVVGTTCMRALESAARTSEYSFLDGSSPFPGIKNLPRGKIINTSLFITPGFNFKVPDMLITNFHQPRSTHLLLVASFVGSTELQAIYNHALNGEYRFLSYGDGMLLEKSSCLNRP